jgi:hypothetical protein
VVKSRCEAAVPERDDIPGVNSMGDERRIDPGHEDVRRLLRVVGPSVAGVGIVLMAVGIGNFFWSFGGFDPPRYFWCAFVGIPLVGLGAAMAQAGYLGRISRYVSGEVAPVQKDTFNYLAEGTSEGVGQIARAVGQGFAAGAAGPRESRQVACPRCRAANPPDANFCGQCGAALGKVCAGCGGWNDPGDRFCQGCGRPLG